MALTPGTFGEYDYNRMVVRFTMKNDQADVVCAILERSGAAIVVQPEDATGIAGAIAGLASDPERRLAMGASGRRFVAGML